MKASQILDRLAHDHDRLDELLADFRKWQRVDWAKAREAFKQFKFGLQRHILWEESVLFPLFEEKTGMQDSGPTVVMRVEHREIGGCLEALHAKIGRHEQDSEKEEERLFEMLFAHNYKEEHVLYPALDRLLDAAEKEAAFKAMEEIPEEAYRFCCGRQENVAGK